MSLAVAELLAAASERWSDAIGVIDGERSFTYRELHDASVRARHGLETLGVKVGDRIAIMLPNGVDFITTLFAIWQTGAGVVPLSKQFQDNEITLYLRTFGVGLVVTSARSLEGVAALVREASPDARVCVPSDLVMSSSNSPAPSSSVSASRASEDAHAIFQLSSGTTGKSKRIVRTHRQLSDEAAMVAEGLGLTHADRVLAVAPFFHSYGMTDALTAALVAGATIIPVEDFNAEKVVASIRSNRATVFPGVPFMFGAIARTAQATRDDLASLRFCVSSGAPLDRATFDGFRTKFGIQLRQQYGATELGAVAIHRAPDVDATWASVGCPLRDVEVEVWNDQDERALVDEIGEIAVRSKVGATEYLDAPAEIARTAFRKGYFATGDLGRIDANGNVYVVGRKTLFINSATHKVDPREVEELLLTHASVADVVVVGIPGAHGGEFVKAVVVAQGGRPIDPMELASYCRGKISDYKVPIVWQFRDSIPKSATGKILRKYLIEPPSPEQRSSIAQAVLATDETTEQWVNSLVRRILGLESVPNEVGFYELGGTSLAATNVVVVIEVELGVTLPDTILSADWTVRSLSSFVRTLARGEGARMAAILQATREGTMLTLERGGGGETIYCIHPVVGLGVHYAAFARSLGGTHPVKVFQDPQLFGQAPFTSVELMANAYVTQLLENHPSPDGKYNLLGYSFGAYVAFEMALRLADRMGKLILIDPPFWDGNWRVSVPGFELLDKIASFARPNADVRSFFEYTLPDTFAEGSLTKLSVDEAASKALPVMFERFSRGLLHEIYDATGQHRFTSCLRSILQNDYLASTYRASQIYDGRITIIAVETNAAASRWQEVTTKPLDLSRVGGAHHLSLMTPPSVSRVADIVLEVLAGRA
jgi:long-chain acyl-CoA synthetase